jgi:multidrug efflux system membrane fusion protein
MNKHRPRGSEKHRPSEKVKNRAAGAGGNDVDSNRASRARSRRRKLLIGIVLVAAAGGGFYWYWQQGPEPSRGAGQRGRAAVPVSVAAASRQDLPIYATGLGTVQASFTIGIHSQVDGIMQDVLFTEGQRVKKGDVLAKIDPRLFQAALDQAKGKKLQNVAMLGAAEKDLARSKSLVVRNVATQQTVDQQEAKVDQLKASIVADEATIEAAQTQFDFTAITAPSDGRVGVRNVDPGNLVHASDARAIASLVLTKPSAVLFTLPMQVLDDLRDAMARGPVEVAAFDQNNRRELSTGTILLIDNAIDTATATIRLKAMFPNEDERLWPGEFVNARVLLEMRHGALAIPTPAIQRGQKGLFAWVVTDKSTVEARPIELGPVSGDLTIVTAGLSDGERVVTNGQYRLQVNATVAVSTAAASTGGAP